MVYGHSCKKKVAIGRNLSASVMQIKTLIWSNSLNYIVENYETMGKTRGETKLDRDNHIKSTEKNKTWEAKILIYEPSTSLSDYLIAIWYYKYVGHLLVHSHYIQIKKNQIKHATVLALHGCRLAVATSVLQNYCFLTFQILCILIFCPTLSSNF